MSELINFDHNSYQVDFFTAPSHLTYCGHFEESSDISFNSHQIASILHLVFLSLVPFVALIFIHIRYKVKTRQKFTLDIFSCQDIQLGSYQLCQDPA